MSKLTFEEAEDFINTRTTFSSGGELLWCMPCMLHQHTVHCLHILPHSMHHDWNVGKQLRGHISSAAATAWTGMTKALCSCLLVTAVLECNLRPRVHCSQCAGLVLQGLRWLSCCGQSWASSQQTQVSAVMASAVPWPCMSKPLMP